MSVNVLSPARSARDLYMSSRAPRRQLCALIASSLRDLCASALPARRLDDTTPSSSASTRRRVDQRAGAHDRMLTEPASLTSLGADRAADTGNLIASVLDITRPRRSPSPAAARETTWQRSPKKPSSLSRCSSDHDVAFPELLAYMHPVVAG